MIEKAPLPTCIGGQIGPDLNPAALARCEDDVGQALIDSIVADADSQPHGGCRPIGGRWLESCGRAQHATARQRKRNRETAGDWHDERRTGNAVDLPIGDLKAGRRPLLGGVEFSEEVDGLHRSVLDVPACRA